MAVSARRDWIVQAVVGVLIVSGLLHLTLLFIRGGEWEGGTSLRKPGLFGVSTGLTVWSLDWVLRALPARRWEAIASRLVALCLLVEVALITLQYWRGVPSHFNEATYLDKLIEQTMLGLILIASVWIAWLSMRVLGPLERSPAMNLAIRAGMVWLLISCLLGIATTLLGKWNLMHGRAYETWGQAGVLKFPHGIALHAIQFLPLCAWLAERWQWRDPYRLLQGLTVAQFWLVVYAVWQTSQGRARMDVDVWGIMFLAASVLSLGLLLFSSASIGADKRTV